MTSSIRVFRTLLMSVAVVLYAAAAAAAPQSVVSLPDDDRGGQASAVSAQHPHPHAATSSVKDQISALDTRIHMLATDMRMFSGVLKVDAMASLLTAMIERQTLVDREMRTFREEMMRRLLERSAQPAGTIDLAPEPELDLQPGGMCAPVW
jgi:hypothetical protein